MTSDSRARLCVATYAGTFAKLGKVLPQGAQLHVEHVLVNEAVVELRSRATAVNGMRFDNRYCMVLAFDGETIVRGRSYVGSAMVARLSEEIQSREPPLPARR
jgi:uncharacterized protein